MVDSPSNPPTRKRHRELQTVENYLRSHAPRGRPMQILEAGCGRNWLFPMPDVSYELTGVDLDQHALEARKTLMKDLDHAIYGDLRTVELENGQYDVIYCSFVLEHVPGAEDVLKRFMRWLAPGGIIVVRVPDFDSIYGFTTRITPLWVHVLYRRHVIGMRDAGKPGFAPYPTFYDPVISRRGMRGFAQRTGLLMREEMTHGEYRRGNAFMRFLATVYGKTVALLSLGRIHARSSNITFILEKPLAEQGSSDVGAHRAFTQSASYG